MRERWCARIGLRGLLLVRVSLHSRGGGEKDRWNRKAMGGEHSTLPFDLKDVLVKLSALAFALPTFSFGFRKSFCFSLLRFALAPIASAVVAVTVVAVVRIGKSGDIALSEC